MIVKCLLGFLGLEVYFVNCYFYFLYKALANKTEYPLTELNNV